MCFDDAEPHAEIDLPVHGPLDLALGAYLIRVLASRETEIMRMGRSGVATVLDLDPSAMKDGLRVLKPWQVRVDGVSGGYGFGDRGI